ncbi:hypothetical protein SAMN05421637_2074 [Demequina mangrovi]|uniref:Uncharacterized protein n=1 Tax=Demequina mangrovi TaxID=1043493 RepID=A0A1H6ZC03_9MICO|nr:hypothetical protein SAMN05421637_2074 [Demequina mangrovi]
MRGTNPHKWGLAAVGGQRDDAVMSQPAPERPVSAYAVLVWAWCALVVVGGAALAALLL